MSLPPSALLLVEQIRPRASQIDNLRAAISILFESCTLKTVKGVGYSFSSADNTFVLVVAEGTFVADANEGCGTDVGIADGTFAVTFVAETAERDARGLAAHSQVGMMAGHGWAGMM